MNVRVVTAVVFIYISHLCGTCGFSQGRKQQQPFVIVK